jgi:hypothetical protein
MANRRSAAMMLAAAALTAAAASAMAADQTPGVSDSEIKGSASLGAIRSTSTAIFAARRGSASSKRPAET